MKKKIVRLIIVGLKLGAILMVMIALTNLYIVVSTNKYIMTLDELDTMNVDCVMVLGAGVFDNGTPSMMLEDRILRGIDVYSGGFSSKILMSGDHGRVGYDEVNIMKHYATDLGVDSKDIFMDHAGFSTYESMYRSRDVFEVEDLIIITQDYHMFRAIYNARGLGLDAYGVVADQHRFKGQSRRDLREVLARFKDFFYVMMKPEPTFLGDVIPIEGDGNLTND